MKVKKDVILNLALKAAPIIGLVVIAIVFAIVTKGRSISSMNLGILVNQFVITALVATGAVYTFACGAIDLSTGGSLGLSCIGGALAGMASGSFVVMILATTLISLLLAVCKGLLTAYLTLPVFIVTIILGNFLSAIGLVLLGTQTTLSLRSLLPEVNITIVNVVFVAGFFIVAAFLFNYTKIGKSCKLYGANNEAAKLIGISNRTCMISAFLINGVGVALAAILTIVRTGTVTAQTGSGIGQDVLVAVVLGGMPLSGGPKSRVSAAVIGAATITVLNNGLSMCNVSNDMIQIVRGILFLVVVFMASFSYRTKLLPRK